MRALFLSVVVVVAVSWWGLRRLAVALFDSAHRIGGGLSPPCDRCLEALVLGFGDQSLARYHPRCTRLYGIALVLAAAFAVQLLLSDLPCPLCLLQRIQFAMPRSGLS